MRIANIWTMQLISISRQRKSPTELLIPSYIAVKISATCFEPFASSDFWFDTYLPNPNHGNMNRTLVHTQRGQLIVGQCHSDRRQSSGITELVMFLFIAHLLINVSQTQSSFQWYDWAISRVNGVETLSVRRHAIHSGMNLGLPMVFFLLHLPQWNDSILLQYIAAGISHLTHWGRVTHVCVGKLTIIGSDNGLSLGRCQAIIWTNAGILLIRPLGTIFSGILIEISTFPFTKTRLKASSAKWWPFCLGLNVLDKIYWISKSLDSSYTISVEYELD